MRRFRVIVNGLAYEVDVEELGTEGQAPAQPAAAALQAAAAAPAPAPAPQAAPAEAKRPHARKAEPAAPAVPAAAGKGVVASPLPGAILDVKVQVGDTVSEGQVVAILEAMKMENEIVAPHAGSVTAVHVKPGAAVGLGDVLLEIG